MFITARPRCGCCGRRPAVLCVDCGLDLCGGHRECECGGDEFMGIEEGKPFHSQERGHRVEERRIGGGYAEVPVCERWCAWCGWVSQKGYQAVVHGCPTCGRAWDD